MIHLHYASRLENLVKPLATAVAASQRARPLEPVSIIIPSRVVEDFIKLRLSERIGVAANLHFAFLPDYLGGVVHRADPGLIVLEADALRLLLFECLRDSMRDGASELAAVREYSETGSSTPAETDLRLFRLSGEVARLFREYSISRRPMLRGWRGSRQIGKPPFDQAERWQRHLWLSVFEPDGTVRPRWLDDAEHRWMLLPDAFDALEDGSLTSVAPAILHVFGLACVEPVFARMFSRLGKLLELHVYALNPSLEFWEDVASMSHSERVSWQRRQQRLGGDSKSDSDPFRFDAVGDNPALRLWARPGREYIRLLNALTDCDFEAHSGADARPEASTVLQQLQSGILHLEPERRLKPAGDSSSGDASIRFLACPGVRREAEIVANTIWWLVQGDSLHPRLRFHEIAVEIPDQSFEAYLPRIEAAFAELHHIPLEIVDRRFARHSGAAEAIVSLLRLPLGRFARGELRLSFPEWAGLLRKLILTQVTVLDSLDEQVRDRFVRAIESIATPGIRGGEVSYAIACELAIGRISDLESRRTQFAGRGVAVGALSSLRSLPFRAIFMAGINDADFPQRARRDPLDLRLATPAAADVTPADRDRYLFLETLLAARERLFMSYVSRDQQTGELLEPSTLIRELQSLLRGYLNQQSISRLTIEHPASRYSLRYFGMDSNCPEPDAELFSFDPRARRGARTSALRSDLARHCGETRPVLGKMAAEVRSRLRRRLRMIDLPPANREPGLSELRLPLAAFARFLECPTQGAARYALGMLDDDQVAEEGENEPVAQSLLDRTVVLRQAFSKSGGDVAKALDEYDRLIHTASIRGRAPTGFLRSEARAADTERLREWIAAARQSGASDLAQWQRVRIGRGFEHDRALPEIRLAVPIQGAGSVLHTQPIVLYGDLGLTSPDLDASIRCVLRGRTTPRDFLNLFLSGIALAAAGATKAAQFRAIVASAGGRAAARLLTLPPRERALKYFADLASHLLSGENHYFLPIEAVDKIWPEVRDRAGRIDLIAALEDLRELKPPPCACDYGPVRNARRFRPPAEALVRTIVEGRFGLIAGIFERGPRA